MSNFVLCPENKEYLGRYKTFIEAYNSCMKILNNELIDNINPEKIDISTPYITNSKNLLDSLDISHLCCRTHIITHADFYKYLVNRTEL